MFNKSMKLLEPRGKNGVSGYNARFYALMLSATTFVLNCTLIQPIFSLFLTSRGITVVQLGILLSIQSFTPWSSGYR